MDIHSEDTLYVEACGCGAELDTATWTVRIYCQGEYAGSGDWVGGGRIESAVDLDDVIYTALESALVALL